MRNHKYMRYIPFCKEFIKKRIPFFYAGGAVFVLFVLFVIITVYIFDAHNAGVTRIERTIPLPSVFIGATPAFSIKSFFENRDAVKRFYENQDFASIGVRVDFSTEEGKKRFLVRERAVLNKMIEDAIIEELARDRGIRITKAASENRMARMIDEFGKRKVVENNLQRLYGWTTDDFVVRIVRPSFYREELEKKFETENSPTREMREKIDRAYKELMDGRIFDDVAHQYSEGITAAQGGILGWFSEDQLVPNVSDVAFSLAEGQMSEIIESPLGFHIIRVNERREENGVTLVNLSQIIVHKKTFAQWLEDHMRAKTIMIPLAAYEWDKESLTAQFRDGALRAFEENLRKDPEQDPLLLQ